MPDPTPTIYKAADNTGKTRSVVLWPPEPLPFDNLGEPETYAFVPQWLAQVETFLSRRLTTAEKTDVEAAALRAYGYDSKTSTKLGPADDLSKAGEVSGNGGGALGDALDVWDTLGEGAIPAGLEAAGAGVKKVGEQIGESWDKFTAGVSAGAGKAFKPLAFVAVVAGLGLAAYVFAPGLILSAAKPHRPRRKK